MKFQETIDNNKKNCVNCRHMKTKIHHGRLKAVCEEDVIRYSENKGWNLTLKKGSGISQTPKAWDRAKKCVLYSPMY